MRIVRAPAVHLLSLTVFSVGLAAAQEQPIKMGRYRQLFVDNHVIAEMQGVRQVLNQPEKHPANPLLICDRPWEGLAPFVRTVLLDDERETFRMWYLGFAPGQRPGCYAVSADGIHWEKPDLGLLGANNMIPWGSARGIVYSPEDPDPARRYKNLNGRIGACSTDGFTWETPP